MDEVSKEDQEVVNDLVDHLLQFYTWYCPDCSSCGEWGCCPHDCEKCRTSEDHMWDMRLEENQPKGPIKYKSYLTYEEMYNE